MKAMVVSPLGGRVPPNRGVLHNGLGIGSTRRDLEAEGVAAYLTKLRSLVPDMPRKRRLSKLEVIQRVIEYICDLQTALEETNIAHQDVKATTAAMTTTMTTPIQSSKQSLTNGTTMTIMTSGSTTATTTSVATATTIAER